jgi:2-polyprenyl-3-methyl-5-hydroxy-6-metoxy-1,4-benzoquinol methylase
MLKRRYTAEIMDDFSIQDERIDLALRELKLVNTFLGGTAATADGFRILRKRANIFRTLKVLDVGSGGSDVFDSNTENLSITALDKNPRTCTYIRQHSPFIVICGDAQRLPFEQKSFDVVHASLFLHHFSEKEITILLRSFAEKSKFGIIINDLRRSILAFVGIKILTTIFSKSSMVKNDAPLSVLRGFLKSELQNILSDCGFKHFVIKRTWAFRWLVVIDL